MYTVKVDVSKESSYYYGYGGTDIAVAKAEWLCYTEMEVEELVCKLHNIGINHDRIVVAAGVL